MDFDKVKQKLQEKGVTGYCPICKGDKNLSTKPVQILLGEDGDISETSNGYALICKNCGHTDIFDKSLLLA